MNNAKSREHAHTCRKARAIFKLRYKNKNKTNQLSGTICLISLPPALKDLVLDNNNFQGSLDFTRLPKSMRYIYLSKNRFSGTIDLRNLPESMTFLNVRNNALSGTVRVPRGFLSYFEENDELTVERIEE